MSRLRPLALVLPLVLAACAVGPNYKRPALSPSAGYGAEATAPPEAAYGALHLDAGADVAADWWRVFHCAALDDLVSQALTHSPTIDAARQALRAAHEQSAAQRGAYFPTVGLSVQPSRQNVAPTLASGAQSGADLYSLTTTQVSVSFVPDLFGANRRAVESLVAQEDQERFELEAARLTLASNVAQAAIQDALLRAQIDSARMMIADQETTYASFQRQYQLGQASKADLAAQETLLAQARAALPPLEKQFRINRDLLSALVGRTPAEPVDVKFDFADLSLPAELPLSLPADLVRHRPDVRIAEAELHAASAQVGVAAAARWPNLTLEGAAGAAGLGGTPRFDSATNFWSVAATLTQPVFEGGTLLHHERAAKAAYRQAAAQYQGAVVAAFQNTADTLHALWTDADALSAAETADAAASRGLDIARKQLALGDVSRLAVLSAEQARMQTRMALLQARANRYDDVVALYQALGGGWWNAPDEGRGRGKKVGN